VSNQIIKYEFSLVKRTDYAITVTNKLLSLPLIEKADVFAEAGLTKFQYPNNDYKGAIQDFTKAIEIYSKEPYYYRYRSWAKKKLGDFAGVLCDQNKEIELAPLNPNSYLNRAYTKEKLNDLSGAISDYNIAIELEPENSYYYNYRADVKRKQGDFSGAIADYTKIIELNEIARTGYYMRGKVKHKIGDTSCCEDWKAASALGNTNAATLLETYCSGISN
jgi:tetratricopeptide (TPR) repeat protein